MNAGYSPSGWMRNRGTLTKLPGSNPRWWKPRGHVTTAKIADANGDGIIGFGTNKRLDFNELSSAHFSDEAGATIKSLEFDGSFDHFGVTYFVYSLVGSAAGVASVSGNDLIGLYS